VNKNFYSVALQHLQKDAQTNIPQSGEMMSGLFITTMLLLIMLWPWENLQLKMEEPMSHTPFPIPSVRNCF